MKLIFQLLITLVIFNMSYGAFASVVVNPLLTEVTLDLPVAGVDVPTDVSLIL